MRAHQGSATLQDCFVLRPGTTDAVVFDQVVSKNEYRLPDQLSPDAVVIDIGAHVGAFSYLALTRGAAVVVGYEPEPSNHRSAEQNLAPFGLRAQVHRAAVWRSDARVSRVPFHPSSDSANMAGGSVIWDTHERFVDAVRFDAVVEEASTRLRRRIDLVKMDCEGAEFPILLTSHALDRVDAIVGEYHELRAAPPAHTAVPGYSQFATADLVARLHAAGFAVELEPRATGSYGQLGLFFARRSRITACS